MRFKLSCGKCWRWLLGKAVGEVDWECDVHRSDVAAHIFIDREGMTRKVLVAGEYDGASEWSGEPLFSITASAFDDGDPVDLTDLEERVAESALAIEWRRRQR